MQCVEKEIKLDTMENVRSQRMAMPTSTILSYLQLITFSQSDELQTFEGTQSIAK